MGKHIKPEIGKTYIMQTTKPDTVIFTFVGVGEYLVKGNVVKTASFTDPALVGAYSVTSIREYTGNPS